MEREGGIGYLAIFGEIVRAEVLKGRQPGSLLMLAQTGEVYFLVKLTEERTLLKFTTKFAIWPVHNLIFPTSHESPSLDP